MQARSVKAARVALDHQDGVRCLEGLPRCWKLAEARGGYALPWVVQGRTLILRFVNNETVIVNWTP